MNHCVIHLVFSLLFFSSVAFAVQDADPLDHNSKFESMWNDLASSDLEAITDAILAFSSNTDGVIEFLETKVVALRLDEETFEQLLNELCGDDEVVAKIANERLRYLDPRILMPIREINEKFELANGSARFAEVILDREYGTLGDIEVPYNFSDDGNGEIASGLQVGPANHWVSPDLELLCRFDGKKSWSRAVCAIKILEHIGTPEATNLLARLAQGNPACPPTKLAREIGMKLKKLQQK